MLGTRQSGFRSSLRLLSVVRDEDVIVAAREVATRVVENDPTLAGEPALAVAVAIFAAGRWMFRRLSPHFEDFV